MGKKKSTNISTGNVEDSITKEFGDMILCSGDDLIDSPQITIPVSPAHDIALSGGVPEGSFVIITGKPKLGKTNLALNIAVSAQKPEYSNAVLCPNGRHVYYINIEHRIKSRDFQGVHGLLTDKEHLTIIQSQPGNILMGEDFLDIAERLIKTKPGCVVIIDSFSDLCTRGEMASDLGDRYRADAPLLLAKFCRRIGGAIAINKSIVIGITHIIANQGNGMSPWSEASGQKVQYRNDVKIRGLYFKLLLADEKPVGQEIYWECTNSALGPPSGKYKSYLRYGYGVDDIMELIDLGLDLTLIQKSGAWYELSFLRAKNEDEEVVEGPKAQGTEKLRALLFENPEWVDILRETVNKMLL